MMTAKLPRRCFLTVALLTSLLLTVPPAARADSPKYAPVQAELIKLRGGIGNVLAKLHRGEPVKIAYLGGSITAAVGWRVKSLEWFRKTFPDSEVTEIHAAIGGTGSDLGAFRVGRDALQHNPDLMFVEFAVNDGGAAPEQIWKAMEGIVRQTWAHNPQTDICFVYTYKVGYEEDLRQGMCPRAAGAMELLADHYDIPSINFALEVVRLEEQDKLIYQSAEPTKKGVIRFSSDGVHPLDEGHEIYADLVAKGVTAMRELGPVDHQSQLAESFVDDHWQAAKMVPITADMLTGNWQALPADSPLAKSFSGRLGTVWEASDPRSQLHFRFRGSIAKLYDLLGPDGGQVIVTVDGVLREKPIPRFDSHCTYHRIATLPVFSGTANDDVHEVTVEIHPDQPDRSSVAFRLKDPEQELKQPKYQGTKLRVGQLLLLGDLVE